MDASGDILWANTLSISSFTEIGTGIAVDGSGNIYTISTDTYLPAGSTLAYMRKFNSDGTEITSWADDLGSGAPTTGTAITVDAAGDSVYITGSFNGTQLGFSLEGVAGNQSISSDGALNAYVAKLDGANGQFIWVKDLGLAARRPEPPASPWTGRGTSTPLAASSAPATSPGPVMATISALVAVLASATPTCRSSMPPATMFGLSSTVSLGLARCKVFW